MFNLKISLDSERRTIPTFLNSTIADALERNDVNTTGATISLNGRIMGPSDFGKTFESFGITENEVAMLSVVVKADSAA